MIDFTEFKLPDGTLNLEKLMSTKLDSVDVNRSQIKKFSDIALEMNAINIRKLLRKLPDTTRFLIVKNDKMNSEVSVEFLQRIFVVQTYDSLTNQEFQYIKSKHTCLMDVDYSGYVE
jgi:competence protein ComGF